MKVLLFTAASAEEVSRIGRTLVEEGLAACVNVLPSVRSVYRWEGKLHDEAEALGIAKVRDERAEPAVARIRALHAYQVPEVLLLEVSGGNPDYLSWVAGSP